MSHRPCLRMIGMLALWWFLAVIGDGYGATIVTQGPFYTKAQCDWGRAWTRETALGYAVFVRVSFCWTEDTAPEDLRQTPPPAPPHREPTR